MEDQKYSQKRNEYRSYIEGKAKQHLSVSGINGKRGQKTNSSDESGGKVALVEKQPS